MLLFAVVIWSLLSGLDDLAILLAWLWSLSDRRGSPVQPEGDQLHTVEQRSIAILVPAWREDSVIERMLERNIATLRYERYDIFVGTYPNDRATQAAVARACVRDPRIHLVVGPKPGPTSKADCLNAIYRRVREIEAERERFDLVLIHDAEDVLDPDELHWKNWFASSYDMVQTAVLPIATPALELTHGLYCDDFAEFHTKDMRARNWLGGFVPSCGVATAFARDQLEKLAADSPANDPFTPGCLTEDYELGYRLHCQGASQIFVALPAGSGPRLATREYFPRKLRSAIRQRSRWLTGIVYQGWRNHGWGRNATEAYWFWRDRKGVIGSPLSLALSVVIGIHLTIGWPWLSAQLAQSDRLNRCMALSGVLSVVNLLARCWCSSRIYGIRFGSLAPLRMLWGNWVNTLALGSAGLAIGRSVWHGKPLGWRKTDHAYPWADTVAPARSLGEIFLQNGWMKPEELVTALETQPAGMSLGEHLWRQGRLSAEQVQLARNAQHGLHSAAHETAQAARVLPVEMAEKWRVVPVGISSGELRLASVDIPNAAIEGDLGRVTRLRPRLVLVTPAHYGLLRDRFINDLKKISQK